MAGSGVTIVIAGQDNTDKVFNQIQANLKRTEERAHETESALSQLGETGKRSLEMIGLAVGVREVIESFKEAVHAALEYGESLNDASTKTGMSVESLSVLRYAANQAGTDFEGVATAMTKMGAAIAAGAEGNKQAAVTFKALGLNVNELASKAAADGPDAVFKRVAQAVASTENSARRIELVRAVFGKAGPELIETLINLGNNWETFTQKTKERGLLLSPETAERLEAANKALKDVDQAARGTGIRLTVMLAPAIEAIANAFIHATNGGQMWADIGKTVGEYALSTAQDFALLVKYIRLAKAEYDSWSAHIDAKGDKFDAKWGFTEGQRTKSRERYQEDVKRSKEAAKEIADAKSAYEKSMVGFGEALKKTRDGVESGAPGPKPKPGGFEGIGDLGELDKVEAALKQRDAALLRLAEQGESFRQQRARNAQEIALAQLENDHKQQLISDEDYYAQKLAIQNASYDQQLASAKTKIAQIDDAIAKLRADESKQGAGTSKGLEDASKIADLQAKQLQVESEIAKIQTQAAKDQKQSEQDIYELARKRLQLSDELAAKVEAQHGLSIDARLKQNDDEYAIEREKLVMEYGASSVEVGNADQIDKTRRDQIAASLPEAQSNVDIAAINARRSGVAGARARGAITTLDAKRQMIELDREEARALQPVLEAYQRLSDEDGGLAATQKVIELQERIQELNSPIDDVAHNIREGLDGAFEGLFDNIAAGKNALEDFAHDVERILSDAVYRQYVEPLIQNVLAGAIPGSSEGSSLPNAETAGNPGAVPKGLNVGAILGGLIPGFAKGPATSGNASKSAGMNVTVTLVNDSDAKLKIGDIMKQGGSDLDKFEALFAKSFGNGGIVRQLMMGS